MTLMFKKARRKPLRRPEVVLNLWAYADDSGVILRLAGKAYVMDGDDGENLDLLKQLAATDFLSAEWVKVPENFKVLRTGGRELLGAALASVLSEPARHGQLFEPLMRKLARAVPQQLRCVNGEYQPFTLPLPDNPLCVTTVVLETEDGSLVPLVN